MAINQHLNPWGRKGSNLDAQRSDLWVFDASALIRALTPSLSSTSASWGPAFANFQKLWATDVQASWWWTKSVSLPVQGFEATNIKQDTGSNQFPGKDFPGGGVRVEFHVDTCTIGGSKVIATIMGWDALRSVGHVDRYRNLPLLPSASYKPNWLFDFNCVLLKGSQNGKLLDPSGAWTLSKCWLEDWKVGTYTHASNGEPLTLSATLQAGAVWPVDPDSIGFTNTSPQSNTLLDSITPNNQKVVYA